MVLYLFKLSRYNKMRQASKLLGVTPQTLRRWEREGQLTPDRVSEGRTRYYDVNDLHGLCEVGTDLTVACPGNELPEEGLEAPSGNDLERRVKRVVLTHKDRLLRYGKEELGLSERAHFVAKRAASRRTGL